jgi:hypothetical protein
MATKKKKTDENDFEALDRLARGITLEKLRPLTAQQRRRWEAARRCGRGKGSAPLRCVGRTTRGAEEADSQPGFAYSRK